jgi:hypothetical protein
LDLEDKSTEASLIGLNSDDTKGYLVTTGRFTKVSINWVTGIPIHLVVGNQLVSWIRGKHEIVGLDEHQVVVKPEFFPYRKISEELRYGWAIAIAIIVAIALPMFLLSKDTLAGRQQLDNSQPEIKAAESVQTTPTTSDAQTDFSVSGLNSPQNLTPDLKTVTPLVQSPQMTATLELITIATPTPRLKDKSSLPCYVGQIKGNKTTHFYHLLGWKFYNSFPPDSPIVVCFDTEEQAKQAGYKPGTHS